MQHNVIGLSFYTTDESLSEAFSQFGQVVEGFNSSLLHFFPSSYLICYFLNNVPTTIFLFTSESSDGQSRRQVEGFWICYIRFRRWSTEGPYRNEWQGNNLICPGFFLSIKYWMIYISRILFLIHELMNSYLLQVLNGRVIFVDKAKPRIRFDEAVPVARGPPDPLVDKWFLPFEFYSM